MKSYHLILLISAITLNSCKKSGFLNERPNKAVVVPKNLEDFQQIIDNESIMNGIGSSGVNPTLGELASDNYYMTEPMFSLVSTRLTDKNQYLWSDEIGENANQDWLVAYKTIFYANIALDGIVSLQKSVEADNIKGSALFYRAHSFYQLAQNFAEPYDEKTAENTQGIPLRLNSLIDEKVKRASVAETYNRIIIDLLEAASLLPMTSKYKTRPSGLSVLGLLSRIYLNMGRYEDAFKYANLYLQEKSDLLNYNLISSLPNYRENPEVIFQSLLIGRTFLTSTRNRIDSSLYASYSNNDLRKTIFFRSATNPAGGRFRMSYDGSTAFWCGIATDEIYLIRAECHARSGNVNLAMKDLNYLMKNRWKSTVVYPEIIAISPKDALDKILIERRKELVFRGLRWTDLRRLNKEGANIILTRVVNGQTYIMQPNDLRYTFLIPPSVITFNPDWIQNKR